MRSHTVIKTIRDADFAPVSDQRARRSATIPLSFCNVGIILAVADFVAIVLLSLLSGSTYHYVAFDQVTHSESFMVIGVACAVLFGLAIQSQRLYLPAVILHRNKVTRAVLTTWGMVFFALLAVVFLTKISFEVSRGATVCFFVSGAVVLTGSRVVAQRTLKFLIANNYLAGRRRVVVFGDDRQLLARDIFGSLNRHGYSVSKQIGIRLRDTDHVANCREIVAAVEQLQNIVRQTRVDEIFLVLDNVEQRSVDILVERLRTIPIPVRLLFDQRLSALLSRSITDLGAAKAVKLQSGPLTATQQAVKRSFDLVLSFIGLVVLAPVLLLIALAIRIDSPGPVLFRQRRAGFSGRIFRIYKFRSMTTLDDGVVVKQATRNDDRVTRVGRFLRRTSLDELPQLLNVLQGDMSLVGPRPHAISHDSEYDRQIATYALRHHMKPGITGWAQVNGFRGETADLQTMEARVKYDIWYIGHWSLLLDVTAIALTVVQIVRPKNVY